MLLRAGPVYDVRPGDTLGGVAARFATTPAALLALNADLAAAAAAGGGGGAGLQAGQARCVLPPGCAA